MAIEKYITAQRIATSIMLNSKAYNSFMIVEGDVDYNVFKKFIIKEKSKIEIAFGYTNVIEVIQELNLRKCNIAVGIIDSDFRKLNSNMIENENILHTDSHDIETMIINSNSFEIVLDNYVQYEKVNRLYNNLAGFRIKLFDIAKHLGYLKWLNEIKSLGLIFKPSKLDGKTIDFSKFIDVNSLNFLGYDKLVESVFNFCNGKVLIPIKKDDLVKTLTEFAHECDLNHICNGHDIVHIISLSLRKNVSNMNSKAVNDEQISKELVLAYEARFFMDTFLYRSIKEWEKKKNVSLLDF